jgi:hypothetical protein
MLAVCLLYAPLTVISANRVAAATFRRQVREPLDTTPVDARQRTIGAILGRLRGPVLVGVAGMVVMSIAAPLTAPKAGDPANGIYGRGVLEHLQVPVLVLGAGLLVIALARWVPVPGALPLVVLTLWFGTGALYAPADAGGVVHAPTWFAPWITWAAENAGLAQDHPLGQEMWHLAYLLGLSVLAGVAALLRTPGNRRGLLITATIAVVVAGVGLGLMQQQYPCAVVLGHTGGGLGFSTDSEQTVDGARQAVVFANTEAIPEAAYQWFQRAATLTFCGSQPSSARHEGDGRHTVPPGGRTRAPFSIPLLATGYMVSQRLGSPSEARKLGHTQ